MNELFSHVLHELYFPDTLSQKLWNIGDLVSFPTKMIIGRPGEINKYAYFILEGAVKQYMLNKADEECIVNFWQVPDFFACAMPSFFFEKDSFVFTKTIGAVKGIRFHKSEFFKLANTDPNFYKLLAGLLLRVYLKREQREIRLIQLSSTDRYLHFLEEFPGLQDKISMKELASYLQIHPGSLSRIKKNLKT